MKLVVVFIVSLVVYSQTRIWLPNTNYDEPMNWLGHQLPCDLSKIVFPADLNAAIHLPSLIKVRAIQFSNEGELILKQDGVIGLTTYGDELACARKVVQFKKINIEPWLKPTNWKLQAQNVPNIAVPHVEQVPCIYDNVIFPKDSSFWVQYPEISLSVNSFNIEGQELSNDRLQHLLLSEPGSRQFKNLDYQQRTDVITVKNVQCTDKTGCLCHQHEKFVLDAVCNNLKHICNVTHCINPIKPVGHCCEVCGAHLLLKFDKNNFNIKQFRERVLQYFYVAGYKTLDSYIHKVLYNGDTHIQVVIVEKNYAYKGDSINAATLLHEKILGELNSFNILSSELKLAGPEYWPGAQLRTTVAIILSTLFVVLMFLLLVYIRYGPLEHKTFKLPFELPSFSNFRQFLFVRFENNGENETGGLEFRNRSVASSLFNLDRAFDNPLYAEEAGPSQAQNTSENLKEIQNPTYTNLQKQQLSDEE
ncbi:amnionless [Carabus blaptoides fortunei]